MNNTPAAVPAIFQFKHHQVRTITDDQGDPWWVAKDVCAVLDIATEQIRKLDGDEKGLRKMQTPGGQQELAIINESGLYTLIIRSNKPQAKAFRKWITSEVLPAIRRTGSYAARPTPEPNLNTALIETTTKMLQVMDRIVERLDRLEAVPPVQPLPVEKPVPKKPLALDYSVRSFTPTTLGNRIGLTGKEFNLLLESEGLQVSVRIQEQKQWRPTLAGESHSILLDIGKSRKSGFHLQQLRWFDSVMPLVAAPPSVKKLPAVKPPSTCALLLGLRDLAWSEGMRMRDLAATLIAVGLAKRTKDNVLRPTARAWEHRACVPNSHGNIAWRPEVVSSLIAGRKVAL
jgi:prophage antirepressor-like protein